MIEVAVDKESENALRVAKNVVGASADDNAAALLSVLLAKLGLKDEELIVNRHLVTEMHGSTNDV